VVGRRADVAGLEDYWQRNGNDAADKSWVSSKGHKCRRLEGFDAAALVMRRLGFFVFGIAVEGVGI